MGSIGAAWRDRCTGIGGRTGSGGSARNVGSERGGAPAGGRGADTEGRACGAWPVAVPDVPTGPCVGAADGRGGGADGGGAMGDGAGGRIAGAGAGGGADWEVGAAAGRRA
jgi:hypothetical protein